MSKKLHSTTDVALARNFRQYPSRDRSPAALLRSQPM
jgi:hypothetical protein